MARRWRRRVIRGGLLVLALVAGAGMALPWWWPAVLARFDGVTIGDWKTSGWSSVELRDVTYEREGLRITAARVRVPAFGRWPQPDEGPAVLVHDVVITPQPVVRTEPPPPPATSRIVRDVLRAWPAVQRWLPPAHVERVEVVTGGRPLKLAAVSWDGARVEITGAIPGVDDAATMVVTRPDETTIQLACAAPTRAARLEATMHAADEHLEIEARLAWRENSAQLAASFGSEGLLPVTATFDAPTMEIPAEELGLTGYGSVRGALSARWADGAIDATLGAQAEPRDETTNLPPLAVDVRASSDGSSVRVDSALVHLPGIEAKLSAPLVLALPSGAPAGPAEFTLAVDLAQVPRSPAQGRVAGRVTVAGSPAAAQFSLTGEAIHWRDAEIRSLAVAGRWEPGRLQLERAEVQFADDGAVRVAAEIDLNQRQLTSATLTAKLTSAALQPWLPALPEFSELTIEAHAGGPLARPTHAGTLHWTGLAGVPGGAVAGDAAWEGEGVDALTLHGEASSAAGVTMPFAAALQRAEDGSLSGEVTELAWRDPQGEWWNFAQPARVRFGAGVLAVEDLKLAGDGIALTAEAEVHWPASGRITISASSLAAAHLGLLFPAFAHPVTLDAFDVRATWDQGPVQLDGSLRVSYAAEQDAYYSVQAEFRTDAEDLAFGAVRVYDGSGEVLQGEGRLPLTLIGQTDGFRTSLPRDGALTLKLRSTPNPEFWASIARLTNWQVTAPEVSAELSGTLGAPSGRIEFATESVQPPPGFAGAMQLPKVGDVKFVVEAEDDGLALKEGIFTLDGNWVSLEGRAPWNLWREARTQNIVPWRGAEFAFSADRMPMTVASRALPTVLAPDGDVSFSLRHTPGRGFTGFLILADAAVRALPPIGSLRDIAGRVELDGYAARLPQLGALVGGRPISISGEADIAQPDRPVFDLHLTSARVPLVRQQGLVLRAGLDLRIAQTADRLAHISGTVDLGQSVFVSDLVSLLPTGGSVATPEQRPPYFSVRGAPFADWTLDVAMRGEEFLRIEHPFFKGTLSVEGQLGGTLAEPRATGRVWTTRGSITFPFGSMRVDQFEASLSEQNPFEPVLLGTAATRVYGYDVRLAVSGTLAEPHLLFSSDPPLTSQEVFLMLSAGEMPDTGHVFTSNARAQRLAMFVGRNLVTSFGLGGDLGGEDRLIVRSGEDFSREGGETIYVQYNLDDRWSVVAEKDRFDAVNGGIKFRVIDR